MTMARYERTAWGMCGVGLLGSMVGWIVAPQLFPHAWLAALACWIGWPLGSMALLLIHSITGGDWGYAIRPQLTLGMLTLPFVVIALLPLIPELHALYPWARPDVARDLGNTSYLNVPFAYARGVLYLVLWLGLGALMLQALRQPLAGVWLYRLSPAGLIALMLTSTFASFDAVLSLDPHFNSSIFGMIIAAEAALLALSMATFLLLLVVRPPRKVVADLGKLLLGLTVLWGYFVFMQLLIVWNSDLAVDSPWYVSRIQHGWGVVAGFIFLLHFLVPFLLLLWPQVQGSRRALLVISGTLIFAEIPRAWWLVVPAADRSLSWLDICAMLAMIGCSVGLCMRLPVVPLARDLVRPHG